MSGEEDGRMKVGEQQAVLRAKRAIEKIQENIDKRQYWNAISWSNDLQKGLIEAFDSVLKERDESQ